MFESSTHSLTLKFTAYFAADLAPDFNWVIKRKNSFYANFSSDSIQGQINHIDKWALCTVRSRDKFKSRILVNVRSQLLMCSNTWYGISYWILVFIASKCPKKTFALKHQRCRKWDLDFNVIRKYFLWWLLVTFWPSKLTFQIVKMASSCVIGSCWANSWAVNHGFSK